jgi:hypothetical protein
MSDLFTHQYLSYLDMCVFLSFLMIFSRKAVSGLWIGVLQPLQGLVCPVIAILVRLMFPARPLTLRDACESVLAVQLEPRTTVRQAKG